MIDCIDAYGSDALCTKICQGTLEDDRYPAIKELNIEDCKLT